MITISVHLPDSLHDQIRQLPEKENVSINQLITLAVAEKLSALMTEEYLEERAKKGKREEYFDILSQVPDVEPEEYDKL